MRINQSVLFFKINFSVLCFMEVHVVILSPDFQNHVELIAHLKVFQKFDIPFLYVFITRIYFMTYTILL